MNTQQVQLVQSSFAQVKPIAATAAELFYGRLFEIAPEMRALFKGDMQRQGAMLMSVIGTAVNGLSRPDSIIPVVRALGARHVAYGVKDDHYDIVGSALLWTLKQGLGEAFTDDVMDAWVAAYTLLANVMQQGARDAAMPKAA